MTSRGIAVAGFVILVGSGAYGYYEDPLGTAPVIVMLLGLLVMVIGLIKPSRNRHGSR
jgi:hypothetical protein